MANKKISLYVYSDDFAVGKVNSIVREIDRRNKPDANGKRLARIHAVAFPTIYEATGGDMYTEADFAVLHARDLPAQRRHVRRVARAPRHGPLARDRSIGQPGRRLPRDRCRWPLRLGRVLEAEARLLVVVREELRVAAPG